MDASNITTQASTPEFDNQDFDYTVGHADDADTRMNRFAIRLHETLDFYQLFDIFTDELRREISFGSIGYQDVATKTSITNGIEGQHHCVYALRYEEQSLGSVSITRDALFSDYEIETIEVLLAGLTLPLRNVLRYKKAVSFAQRDELTGLRNASYYQDVIEIEINRAQRYKNPFSLLLFDIDNFKEINVQYSRRAGDSVLVEVAKRINKKARSSDIVYHNGVDQFFVFLPNTEKSKALDAAARIKDFVLADKCICDDGAIPFTISAGVVTVGYEDTASQLMQRVNKSLMQAKILGKNRIYAEPLIENNRVGCM